MIFPTLFVLLLMSLLTKGHSVVKFKADFENFSSMSTLGCEKTAFEVRITQRDENGKTCWDILRVAGCSGRCVSHEIADFRFPYKKSSHPVCVHYGRNKVFVMLRNCEEGALPSAARYEYYEAADCKCQQCSSIDTSCEAPRAYSRRSHPNGGFSRIIRVPEFYEKK